MGKRRSSAEAEVVILNDWQVEEIKNGMAEAGHGDFASDQDVERTLNKWTSHTG
jgi:predicted transcriptional regulator